MNPNSKGGSESLLGAKVSKFQFTVRWLFGVVTLVAVLLGVIAYFRTEPSFIRRMRALGGQVDSEYHPDFRAWAEPCGLVKLRTITGIRVDSDELSNDDLRRLVAHSPRDFLSISSNQVTDEGIAFLSQMPKSSLSHMSHSPDLRINCVNVTDLGLEKLAILDDLYDLEVNGSSTVTGAFLERLSEERPLGEWQGLQTGGPRYMSSLKLHGESVDDRVCQWLVKFREIRFLDLSNTRITDKGLVILQSGKHLKMEVLIVKRTRVTKAGVESFAAARPDTVIIPRLQFTGN